VTLNGKTKITVSIGAVIAAIAAAWSGHEWLEKHLAAQFVSPAYAQDLKEQLDQVKGDTNDLKSQVQDIRAQQIAGLNHRAHMLRRAIFGPAELSAEDIKRAAAALDAQNVPQSGRSIGASR
jgi:hypothetical protein